MLFRPSKFASIASALVLAAGAYVVSVEIAEARVGSRSYGSRGSKTYAAPPATATAPKAANPMERTMTQPGRPAAAAPGAAAGTAAAAQTSRFGGWGGLLMGGLIGAGLASMFGLGAMAGVLGFLLQMALIAGAVWLVMSFFRRRNAAMAGANAGGGAPLGANLRQGMGGAGPSGPGGRSSTQAGPAGFGAATRGAPQTMPLQIGGDDFNAFERLLAEIQVAYGRGDIDALGSRATPEMLSYFAEQLHENTGRGVRNEVGAPKLLQGDLAEAWTEATGDYATVAMRYALTDATVEIATGRVVEGSREEPVEVTEVWTFTRPRNSGPDKWELSAIQQV